LSLKNPSVPSTPIGFTHGLWEHDVFEIFVCGNDGSYIEIEVGPAGHWLVYGFYNYRDQIKDFGERDLKVKTSVNGTIWSGQVCLPKKWLMDSIENCTYNFYQIRKAGKKREYLAWQSIPNIEPDFHRTECFAKIF